MDLDNGVISLGEIGFDLDCGVRVLRTDLSYEDVEGREEELGDFLYRLISVAFGMGGYLDVDHTTGEETIRGNL